MVAYNKPYNFPDIGVFNRIKLRQKTFLHIACAAARRIEITYFRKDCRNLLFRTTKRHGDIRDRTFVIAFIVKVSNQNLDYRIIFSRQIGKRKLLKKMLLKRLLLNLIVKKRHPALCRLFVFAYCRLVIVIREVRFVVFLRPLRLH